MHNFEDYVDRANSAKDEADLFEIYLNAVKKHGLDRAVFCIATHHKDIDISPGIGVIHNYPSDWMSYYFEKNFDKIDPVMLYGLTQDTCYKWDIIPHRMTLKKRQLDCLNFGREAGLNNGVCTPLRGPKNQLAGLSLASSEKKDSFDGNVDLITAYSNHFYVAWKRFLKSKKPANHNDNDEMRLLTEKERDVLTWIAVGKTDQEIAILMSCSHHAIDFHVRNIFKKLEVSSRVLAVTTAMAYGLINP